MGENDEHIYTSSHIVQGKLQTHGSQGLKKG